MGKFILPKGQYMVQGFPVNRSYTKSETDAKIAAVDASVTLLDVSANSTTTPNSIYNLSAGVPVNFKSSDGNSMLYLDETNERIGIGIGSAGTTLDINGVTTFRGNIIAGADNTYDIGASGATRPRTGYFGTSLVSPVWRPQADSTTALQINKADGTTNILNVDTTNSRVGIGTNAPSTQLHVYNASAVINLRLQGLLSDNIGGRIQLYNDTGNAAQFSSVGSAASGATVALMPSSFNVSALQSGGLYIGAGHASGEINFFTAGFTASNIRWKINSAGHFLTPTDNVYDIGASGATRPRTGYFGTSLFTPAYIVGTADTSGIRLDLESGDLAVREGDDSAYGNIIALGVKATARLLEAQGADVASASTITLGSGNSFELTGTTTVDLITNTGWTEGSRITLIANESVTINHGTATSGSAITILLAGAANFAMTANDTLTLIYSSTTAGGVAWREVSRTVI